MGRPTLPTVIYNNETYMNIITTHFTGIFNDNNFTDWKLQLLQSGYRGDVSVMHG